MKSDKNRCLLESYLKFLEDVWSQVDVPDSLRKSPCLLFSLPYLELKPW